MRLRFCRALLLFVTAVLLPLPVAAQACPAGSYCFYVQPGLPLEASHSAESSRSFDIVLSSPVRPVTASYSIAGGGVVPITVSPGSSQRIPLAAGNGPLSGYGIAQQAGVFLIADSPNLTVDHRETFDQEQYSETIKHSAIALGSRFRLAGYSLNLAERPLAGVDAVLIYAPTGGQVTVSAPPGTSLPFWSGSATDSLSVSLSAGQTYGVRTVVGADLDGALLTSSAPVAVSTGGRGWSTNGCGDDGMDGLVPTSALGREHVVRLPTGSFTGNNESRIRVIADLDGTEVRVNGTLASTLAAGSFFSFQATALSYVQTSQPALVWMNGSLNGCELDTVLIPPIAFAPALTELSLDFNVLASSQTPSAELAILIVSGQLSSIRLDGAAPTLISSELVPGRADLSYVRFNVSPGDHNVRAGADFQAMLASRTAPSGLLAYYNPYRIPGCGDGAIDPGEGCDDGNLDDGDGCTQSCVAEPGYVCAGVPSSCSTLCGDGLVTAPGETCDDSNGTAGDGCNSTCRRELTILSPSDGSVLSLSTPSFVGTADPGALITLTVAGSAGMVSADGQGSWNFTLASPLADSPWFVQATATDLRGGSSLDTIVLTIDTGTSVALTAPHADDVLMDTTPTLQGTGEAAASLDLSVDGLSIGATTIQGDGTWQLPLITALAGGDHTVSGVASDAVGNSASFGPVTFTIDASTELTISEPAANMTVNTATPQIFGTAELGATVELSLDGASVASVTVDDTGGWSVSLPSALANGPHSLGARSQDLVGNQASSALDFVVDVRSGPLLLIHNLPDDSFTGDPQPLFSGAADPGARVTVSFDGVTLDTLSASWRGSWSVGLIDALQPGLHTLHAETTDALGRTLSDQHTFRFDEQTSPLQIVAPAAGNVLRSLTPTISGTASPGARLQLQIDQVSVGETRAAADGSWVFAVTETLAEGHHGVRADASGEANNTGSAEVGFYVDTRTFVIIRRPSAGSTLGSATPTIVGRAEPGAIVRLAIDGVTLAEVDVAIDGSWLVLLAQPLGAGLHSLRAHATDRLGNEAEQVQSFLYDPSLLDGDGDGIADSQECAGSACPDSDGDGLPDNLDADDDEDGLLTALECSLLPCRDSDADGRADYLDPDDDQDGRPTEQEHGTEGMPRDTDYDGSPDHLDPDDDGDSLPTTRECLSAPCPDSDGDGMPDWLDADDDNDGLPTSHEHGDSVRLDNDDFDGDGVSNWLDLDANDNGADDGTDGTADPDGDQVPNYLDPDLTVSIEEPALGSDAGPVGSAGDGYTVAGGGGCSSTGARNDIGWLLLLGLASLLRRRRTNLT